MFKERAYLTIVKFCTNPLNIWIGWKLSGGTAGMFILAILFLADGYGMMIFSGWFSYQEGQKGCQVLNKTWDQGAAVT